LSRPRVGLATCALWVYGPSCRWGAFMKLFFLSILVGAGLVLQSACALAADFVVVVPVADFLPQGAMYRAPGLDRILAIIKDHDKTILVEELPLRRARARYDALDRGCVVGVLMPDQPDQLQSRRLISNAFWLFASAGSPVSSLADVKRVGTVIGAELYLAPDTETGYDWSYTTNFENMIAMLRSGRVDAITLSPRYFQSVKNVSFPLRQLGVDPFINVEMGLRCKKGVRAAALIDHVESRWDDAE